MAWFKTQNLSGPLRETSCRTDREYYETEQLSSRTGRGVERNEANISANQQGISNNRVDIDANLRQITSLSQNMDVLRSDVDQNRAGVSMAMAMASIPYSVAESILDWHRARSVRRGDELCRGWTIQVQQPDSSEREHR